MIGDVVVLVICGWLLCDMTKFLREIKKRDNRQNNSQPDKPARVSLQLPSRLRRLLCNSSIQGHPNASLPLTGGNSGRELVNQTDSFQKLSSSGGNNKLVNFFMAVFRLSLNILHCKFWCNHKFDTRKQPNEKS